jgi:hypothetical protein
MDRLTHTSITNCIKELDALEKLTASGHYSPEQVSDWIREVSWNLSRVFRRQRYDSDEFQHILRSLIKKQKRKENEDKASKDPRDE